MKTQICKALIAVAFLSLASCIGNNNKDNKSGSSHDSDYENEAPTYNKTREETTIDSSAATGKRIPKDTVEIKSKGNASSK